jgi:hypothetical protein
MLYGVEVVHICVRNRAEKEVVAGAPVRRALPCGVGRGSEILGRDST